MALDDFLGRFGSGRDAVRARARRLGLGDAANCDPLANAQIKLLEMFVSQLEQALQDEGVDPEVARKVVSRVIQGGLPHPLDAQMRMQMMAQAVEREMVQGTRPVDSLTGEPIPLRASPTDTSY